MQYHSPNGMSMIIIVYSQTILCYVTDISSKELLRLNVNFGFLLTYLGKMSYFKILFKNKYLTK